MSEKRKYCPFTNLPCSEDCPLWMESHKSCAIAVMAEALDDINRILLGRFLDGR